MIEECGCAMLVVHGRTREHKKQQTGPANWLIIKKIKDSLRIPVIANGGMATFEDCMKCLEFTGCDGVMSSESILEYPALFDPQPAPYNLDQIALEYLEMVDRYPGEADLKNVRSHVHKFLHTGFKQHTDLRDKLTLSKTIQEFKSIIEEMHERRKDMPSEKKLGWYHRYWPSENKVVGETRTWITQDWTE